MGNLTDELNEAIKEFQTTQELYEHYSEEHNKLDSKVVMKALSELLLASYNVIEKQKQVINFLINLYEKTDHKKDIS